jgi:hypothetical protein
VTTGTRRCPQVLKSRGLLQIYHVDVTEVNSPGYFKNGLPQKSGFLGGGLFL